MKVISAVLSGCFFLILASCGEDKAETNSSPVPSEVSSASPISVSLVDQFSGQRALDQIKALEVFGPRPPESAGYAKSLTYLEETLGEFGWTTTRQEFQAQTPLGQVRFTNLLARYGKEADWTQSVPFIIGSHLDTKRYASFRFTGSNDSGSSTGVLVELARVLATEPRSAAQVELVFFDGEEALLQDITARDGLYGSKYYAMELNKRQSKPNVGFVLDLVGDDRRPLLVGLDSAPHLRKEAAKAVVALGYQDWVKSAQQSITDDHVPLIQRAGLPTLHLIGEYWMLGYWHTKEDTIDKLTTTALEKTGKLTLKILAQLTE